MSVGELIAYTVLAHMVGDYLIQNHWMAVEKTQRWWPAIIHGATYTLPFLFITQSPLALLVIGGTHAVIDRYRLAKHFIWFRNQFAPRAFRPGHTATGVFVTSPDWLAVWLLIIADNLIHIFINLGAVIWL